MDARTRLITLVLALCALPALCGQSVDAQTIKMSKALFREKVANLNSQEFKYIGDKPAIIDFNATWCRPCRIMAPILEELSEEYKDRIYVYSIDVDDEPALAALFGVSSIPALLFIPMDGKIQASVGATTKASVKKAIDTILLPPAK